MSYRDSYREFLWCGLCPALVCWVGMMDDTKVKQHLRVERERERADIYDLREMRSKTSLSAAEQRKKSCHFVSHHLCIQTFSVVLLTALWEVRLSQWQHHRSYGVHCSFRVAPLPSVQAGGAVMWMAVVMNAPPFTRALIVQDEGQWCEAV